MFLQNISVSFGSCRIGNDSIHSRRHRMWNSR